MTRCSPTSWRWRWSGRTRGGARAGAGRRRAAARAAAAALHADRRAGADDRRDRGRPGAVAPMLRLLQGDVGSGKTLVAAMALLVAVEAGAQGAMLAPTEILARQHYETLSAAARRPAARDRRADRARQGPGARGDADGAGGGRDRHPGRHARDLPGGGRLSRLALVVVDEQHRFGVARADDAAGQGAHPAAPAGDDRDADPAHADAGAIWRDGRQPARRDAARPPADRDAAWSSEDRLDEVVNALGRHLSEGGQAYWVCPLVEESEKSDLAAAEARAETLRGRFGDKVGLVHGRMKPAEKDAVMEAFAAARLGVLVATTVIEVGVDVPNATLIVIEHADRFGLAQLHQLRGRVGRGGGLSTLPAGAGRRAQRDVAGAARADARDQRRLSHRRGGPAAARRRRAARHAPVGGGGVPAGDAGDARRPVALCAGRRAAADRPRRRAGGAARRGGAERRCTCSSAMRRSRCSGLARPPSPRAAGDSRAGRSPESNWQPTRPPSDQRTAALTMPTPGSRTFSHSPATISASVRAIMPPGDMLTTMIGIERWSTSVARVWCTPRRAAPAAHPDPAETAPLSSRPLLPAPEPAIGQKKDYNRSSCLAVKY